MDAGDTDGARLSRFLNYPALGERSRNLVLDLMVTHSEPYTTDTRVTHCVRRHCQSPTARSINLASRRLAEHDDSTMSRQRVLVKTTGRDLINFSIPIISDSITSDSILSASTIANITFGPNIAQTCLQIITHMPSQCLTTPNPTLHH